ncbi:Atg14 domain-containing protein [Sphingomonas sp. Leaf21]|uniref:Atg14 domain-containing protein n=1 Tax=Sphingomonas sp. Leaf21 TaxID=2876550 RepID=UPI001E4D1E15|nr:Atg14 domain-containing protein [Sphingomonas sp. Leaf21]
MPEPIADDVLSSVERIDRAIARIEQAIRARAAKEDALARRHAALKARMADAVSALDEVISRGSAA